MSRATTLTSVAQQLSLSLGVSIGAITLETTTRLSGGVIDAADFRSALPSSLVGSVLTLASVDSVPEACARTCRRRATEAAGRKPS